MVQLSHDVQSDDNWLLSLPLPPQHIRHSTTQSGLPRRRTREAPSQQFGVNSHPVVREESILHYHAAPLVPWALSKAEKESYDRTFRAWDVQSTGFLGKQTGFGLAAQSGLGVSDMDKIWTLADAKDQEKLNIHEFRVFMGLINRRLHGNEVPDVLPAELSPPSDPDIEAAVNMVKEYLALRRGPRSAQQRAARLASDLGDITHQVEESYKKLDRVEEGTLWTAEDDVLEREMSDLRRRAARVRDEVECVSKEPRSCARDEDIRRLHRELASLMHSVLPELGWRIRARDERRERDRSAWRFSRVRRYDSEYVDRTEYDRDVRESAWRCDRLLADDSGRTPAGTDVEENEDSRHCSKNDGEPRSNNQEGTCNHLYTPLATYQGFPAPRSAATDSATYTPPYSPFSITPSPLTAEERVALAMQCTQHPMQALDPMARTPIDRTDMFVHSFHPRAQETMFVPVMKDAPPPSLPVSPELHAHASHLDDVPGSYPKSPQAEIYDDHLAHADTSIGYRMRSLYAYQAQRSDELTFDANRVIIAHPSKFDEEWWYGTVLKDRTTGLFPKSHVERIAPRTAHALFDYMGNSPAEFSFLAGDKLTVVDTSDAGWWKVEESGIVLAVPATFVALADADA